MLNVTPQVKIKLLIILSCFMVLPVVMAQDVESAIVFDTVGATPDLYDQADFVDFNVIEGDWSVLDWFGGELGVDRAGFHVLEMVFAQPQDSFSLETVTMRGESVFHAEFYLCGALVLKTASGSILGLPQTVHVTFDRVRFIVSNDADSTTSFNHLSTVASTQTIVDCAVSVMDTGNTDS